MKNLFTLFALTLCLNLKAQFVTIPDANFVTWLQTNIPSAMNGNQIDTTSVAVITFTYLNIQNLGIVDLTGLQYFDSLTALNCHQNQLSFLPKLPSTLLSLTCSENQLTSMPVLPNTLVNLECDNNQLTILPPLPNTIRYLYCSFNQLTNLPVLPNALLHLFCNNNNLTSIPAIPNSTFYLNCSHNNLLSLPALPSGLWRLYCEYNQLNSLPILPSGLMILICSNNNILCLPILPQIQSEYTQGPGANSLAFDISSNPFTCLPNYIPAMDSVLLNYPLCEAGNINECPNAITGIHNQTKTVMALYPNPSNGSFTIELNSKDKKFIQIFDINGKVSLSQTIENGKVIIDGANLAPGIYNINIKGNNSVTNNKLVIVK